jgi:hypothetical protein
LTPFLPLPKYFDSEWSYAQFRIPSQSSHISLSSASARLPTEDVPDEERCTVGWIENPPSAESGSASPVEHQLIALTYTGGWYRLSIPSSNSQASHTFPAPQTPRNATSSSPPKSVHHSPAAPRTSSGSSVIGRPEKGKEKDRGEKESRDCVLQEFRRFGRWDGWG